MLVAVLKRTYCIYYIFECFLIIIMKFLILTVSFWFYVDHVLTLDCYWNTGCKYKYFSSKTPYEIVRGDIRDSIVKLKECEAVSVWAIIRHGKRNPSMFYANNIKDALKYKDFIVSSYEMGNSSLCAQDIENIKHWNVTSGILDKPNEITNEGHQELIGIGRRLKETFSELLSELQNKEYLFLPGFSPRNHDSAKDFAQSFTNNLTIEDAKNDYSIVAPYSTCGKFQVDVRHNPDVYYQEDIYYRTADYLNMKERVERRLGLNFTFSIGNITALYDLCRFTWEEITKKPSPWCALFSDEDLQVLEYIGDLRHYYRNGYGVSHFSKVLGQMPLANLWTNFEQAKIGRGKTIVSYFTHATMMDMITVALDLYKDASPLTGAHRDLNRKWRSTFLSTFAGNMIAVLNRCSQPNENIYDYSVAFYWNEKPLLEICQKGVCSWQEFEDIFKPFLNATTAICEFKWANLD